MGGLASSWRGWGEEMDDISDFGHKSFMHQLQTTHSVNKMYYLDKSFSCFIMIIRASIMERNQSSNRNRNQRKYTKLNHLVQPTVIILHEE